MSAPLMEDDRKTCEGLEQLAHVMGPELDRMMAGPGIIGRVTMGADDWVNVLLRLPIRCCCRGLARPETDDLDQAVSSLQRALEMLPQMRDQNDVGKGSGGRPDGETPNAVVSASLLYQLRRIAFERCQKVMLLALRGVGYEDPATCRMNLSEFDEVEFGSTYLERRKSDYRERLMGQRLASLPGDRAFVTYEGSPVRHRQLMLYLRQLRGADRHAARLLGSAASSLPYAMAIWMAVGTDGRFRPTARQQGCLRRAIGCGSSAKGGRHGIGAGRDLP